MSCSKVIPKVNLRINKEKQQEKFHKEMQKFNRDKLKYIALECPDYYSKCNFLFLVNKELKIMIYMWQNSFYIAPYSNQNLDFLYNKGFKKSHYLGIEDILVSSISKATWKELCSSKFKDLFEKPSSSEE